MKNLATKQELKTEINDLRKEMHEEFAKLPEFFATKEDLKQFATKEDLKQFATKEDLKQFATKEDLKEIRNDVAEGNDQQVKILEEMRSEMAAFNLAHNRHDEREAEHEKKIRKHQKTLDNHEKRIKILEPKYS